MTINETMQTVTKLHRTLFSVEQEHNHSNELIVPPKITLDSFYRESWVTARVVMRWRIRPSGRPVNFMEQIDKDGRAELNTRACRTWTTISVYDMRRTTVNLVQYTPFSGVDRQ